MNRSILRTAENLAVRAGLGLPLDCIMLWKEYFDQICSACGANFASCALWEVECGCVLMNKIAHGEQLLHQKVMFS